MKKILFIIVFIVYLTSSIYARSGNDIRLNLGYIIPVKNSAFNSSLVLGLGAGFWGIFEFTGNVYLEIDNSKEYFFSKFQTPNVLSAGIGMNIPMGGFYIKGDYQRFFTIEEDISEISVSNYTGSYKLGIGFEITRDIELEFYYRKLLNKSLDLIDGEKQGFIGIGANISL